MTAGQVPSAGDLRSARLGPCPCGHGDLAAEMDRQRPLLERAIAGDVRAFTELYEDQVDDLYRYLLAWTGDQASARELTAQVFRGALTWLPALAAEEGDLAAWLLTMARDLVVEHRSAGWTAGQDQWHIDAGSPDVLVAAARLDDAQREVLVLRLLLGHSVTHTAHLAGYSARVVTELQLAACSTIWQMVSGTAVEPAPPGSQDLRPRWFEGCLEGAYFDPNGDPGLSDVLAVADALRQASAQRVPLPDDEYLRWLRGQLLGELGGDAGQRPPGGASGLGRAFGLLRLRIARHPWVATVVAASAIGVVFGLQAAGPGARSACGDGPCLASTSAATAPVAAAPTLPTLGTTSIFSTSSTPPTTLTTTTRAPTTAPATASPTTAAPTTQTTRRTTTTQVPTTTQPPTTTKPPPTTGPPTTTPGVG